MSDAHKAPVGGSAGDKMEQIHSHLENDRDEKAERMRDELADLLFQPDAADFDDDRLEALLDALDEADTLPELPDTQESLRAFQEKYAPLFASAEAATAEAIPAFPEKKHSRRPFLKVLPVAAALILLFGSVSAQAFGFDLFGALARWTAEIFHIGSDEVPHAEITLRPLAEGENTNYDSLQAAVDAFGITEAIVPTWVPEQFELMNVTASNRKEKIFVCAEYVSGDKFLQICYNEIRTNENVVEKEDGPVETYLCGNIQHYLVSDMGRTKAIWQNGVMDSRITGNVTEEEIIEMIDSIYKEDGK